ncbi:AAA family ATPase [Vibrio sp.]|uniref:AAA family ATPase n=1 Tax=Vibrio sp. TaxID=678 RepID=UPI00378897BE
MITIFFGQKGGAMKSIGSENYAVELAHRGHSVCLVDADPQGTTADFIGYREEAEIEPYITCVQKEGRLTQTLRELDTRFDHVVVDVAGRADDEHSQEMRSGLLAAHVAISPFRPCQDNINTIPKVDQIIQTALDFNENLKVFSLISIAPTHHAVKETEEAREIIASWSSMQLLDTIIHDRKVYRDAYSKGCGVVEMDNKKAAEEVKALVTEVLENVYATA